MFTINTKHHPGQRVGVGSWRVLVAGNRRLSVRSSEHEVQRAATLLASAPGRPVPAQGTVLVVGAATLTVKESPAAVTVIGASQVVRWLQRLPAVLNGAEVSAIAAVAARPGTGQRRPDPSSSDPAPAFDRLAAEVVSAARRRVLVVLVAAAGVVGTIAAVSSSLLSSLR